MKQVLGKGLDAIFVSKTATTDDEGNSQATAYAHPSANSPYVNIQNQMANTNKSNTDSITKINVDLIDPNPFQPRTEFDPVALEELKKSILLNGLIQPVTVRKFNQRYQLISGERRLRAFKAIGNKEITAYIIEVDSDQMMMALAVIENIQREKLNVIELAHAYKRLIEDCKLSQEEVADKVGKDRATVSNTIRLLKLPKEIQDSLSKDELTPGHARALINIPNEKTQLMIFRQVKAEGLSVRKVEQLVQSIAKEQNAPKSNTVSKESAPPVKDTNHRDFEDKLRRILGTKVALNHKKDGTGHIMIEYYSHDELDRLFEMFDVINQTNRN